MEEEHGYGTMEDVEQCLQNTFPKLRRETSLEERETINLNRAYEYLKKQVKRVDDRDVNGLLEVELLQEAHRIVLDGVKLNQTQTKAGEFSENDRYTEFEREIYHYPKPENLPRKHAHPRKSPSITGCRRLLV